jgi:hypothetical protein
MKRINIAIAGVGNCASSLLQGIEHYRRLPREAEQAFGLLHLELGGYRPGDNHTHLVEQKLQCVGDLPAILDDEHTYALEA